MEKLRSLQLLLLVVCVLAFPVSRADTTNLVFDADLKEMTGQEGQQEAHFVFAFTNISKNPITIRAVRASCGCTTPKLPQLPWELPPGTNSSFEVTADLRGKSGLFQKNIFMDTTDGPKTLFVRVQMPELTALANAPAELDARARNALIAKANPKVIFKGECATCHKPAKETMGEKLFVDACAICHESDHRATDVPDLKNPISKPTQNAFYWEMWVRHGKPGSMMPGFAMEHEGPLTDPQIASLVKYLVEEYPKRPAKGGVAQPLTPAASAPSATTAPFPKPTVQIPAAPLTPSN